MYWEEPGVGPAYVNTDLAVCGSQSGFTAYSSITSNSGFIPPLPTVSTVCPWVVRLCTLSRSIEEKSEIMWRRRKMVHLQEELATIRLLDRLQDYNQDFDREFNRDDQGVHAARQQRRSQILVELAKLEGRKPQLEAAWREPAVSR
jgi:hypothetical protein